MKICKRCFQEFAEDENLYQSPVKELADIFSESNGEESVKDHCPQCREELGILNLMGFE
jgi:hypothetical protein